MITGHTVERLNSGPIPSQTEAGQEGEKRISVRQTSRKTKYRRYGQPITATYTIAGNGLPLTKHWTSGGTTATTKSRTPPLECRGQTNHYKL